VHAVAATHCCTGLTNTNAVNKGVGELEISFPGNLRCGSFQDRLV
jgi:hypothetical protein